MTEFDTLTVNSVVPSAVPSVGVSFVLGPHILSHKPPNGRVFTDDVFRKDLCPHKHAHLVVRNVLIESSRSMHTYPCFTLGYVSFYMQC